MSSQVSQIQKAIIAVNRFGLGARPKELTEAQIDPKKWLYSQMRPLSFNFNISNTESAFKQITIYRREQKKFRELKKDSNNDVMMNFSKPLRETQKNYCLTVYGNQLNLISLLVFVCWIFF